MVIIIDTRLDPSWRIANPTQFQELVNEMVMRLNVGADEPDRGIGARRHPSLRLPVYICGGRYDGIAPPANLEALHKQIPGARLEFFEGGHLFFMQESIQAYHFVSMGRIGQLVAFRGHPQSLSNSSKASFV
jgi:pimeloyl-ACP methyl ester carboxylesterase